LPYGISFIKEVKMEATERIIRIPLRSIYSALGLMALLYFAYLQLIGYIIPGTVEIFAIKPRGVEDIELMWVPIVGYVLLASIVCLAIMIVRPLKRFVRASPNGGLIGALLWGLIFGFSLSLFCGVLFSLDNPSFDFGGYLLIIFLGVFLVGFFPGVFFGLRSEFKENKSFRSSV
jgi:hypothetical protein